MIDTNETYSEPLYLDKENENYVYINDCHSLKEHQIGGLRFLYRQFKKGKPGAVLNFPPGSGKSHITTLFLNAVSSLLKERTLILCTDDDEIEHWKELFLSLTGYSIDDIAIESSNPRLKKKIFLKKVDDLSSYSRCNWCVVIIKDDMCKSLQKVSIDADFKIWITSTDVKNTRILQEYKESNKRKNKDATGTKFKRSKNTIHNDESNASMKLEHIPYNTIICKENIINTSKTESNDLGDIIIKNEIDSQDYSSSLIESTCNKTSEINHANKISEASESQKFKEAINEIIINENKSETVEDSTESLDFKEQDSYCISEQNSESILEVKNVDNFPALETNRKGNESEKNMKTDTNMDFNDSIATEKSERGQNVLEQKMSELEERTMRKFKGSLLDSIF
ncbi:unnamed protein product [Danaus chrysippus]|uniref:(African queen) hypothetical protein n=1 Tax=Danaus chrysippus TaxID=151541 RepID=A0A8J2R770_9NEOP|nr:unnamed protein product [Danaus chrysippus]